MKKPNHFAEKDAPAVQMVHGETASVMPTPLSAMVSNYNKGAIPLAKFVPIHVVI